MNNIIVIGGGGHAKVVINLIHKINEWNLLGYVDSKDKGDLLGVKYLGDDTALPSVRREYQSCAAIVGVGAVTVTQARAKIWQMLRKLNFELPAIISPDAVIARDVKISEGTLVGDGAVISVGTVIGEACIVNTLSSVDHDCKIADFAHIAPGATLCGEIQVGANALIGAGSTIVSGLKIGANVLIGAGSVVTRDCLASGVYMGSPAKPKIEVKI